MRAPPQLLFGIVALAILLPACSGPLEPGHDTAGDTAPDAGGDLIPDLPAEIDDAGPELPGDVDPEELDASGGFLDPCEEDGDCASGYCVEVDDGLACTVRCEDQECPEPSWDCVETEGGGLICVPACEAADCEALGAECGAPEGGCGGVLDCGACGPEAICGDDFACACSFLECGGVCCVEGEVCKAGQCAPPLCLPSDATCDGVDDDCDGDTDDDYVVDGSCGVGACLTNNEPSECINGVELPCAAGTPAPADPTCDGVDDDCDGATDEDYAQDTSCGTGWCQQSNVPSACVDGLETPCVPGESKGNDLTCDGVDDDCDGFTDDNFVPDDDCGVGACGLDATPSACSGGQETPCTPGESLADEDLTCNGVDEDCDGGTDEDYLSDSSCGVGACLAANLPSTCLGGVEIPCAPGAPPASVDLTCDGVDDDCDGDTDEDYAPVTACGIGICKVNAIPSSCEDGLETPCVPGNLLGDDVTCDGVDDDCDGSADEDAIPPCIFGDPVTGLPVTFLSTQGVPSGVVTEGDEGSYLGVVVDLDAPAGAGQAMAEIGGAGSTPAGFEVVAGSPATIHLLTSRGTVYVDAPVVRAVAEVLDAKGAPAPSATAVDFGLDGLGAMEGVPGEALGDGRFAAWLSVPADAFNGGTTGAVTVTAGQASAAVTLVAAGSPAALDLGPGRVALLLPSGPALAGDDFEVPVVVNTGDDVLGLYDLTVIFDKTRVQLTAVSPGAAGNLTAPEAGNLVTANALGEVSFNGISANPLAGMPQGAAVEIAVLQFSVPAALAAEAEAIFSGTVNELGNTLLTDIRDGVEVVVHDGVGQGSEGQVTVREPALRGVLLRPGDPVMFQDAMLTGLPAMAPLVLTGLGEDHALSGIDPGEANCLSLSPGVVDAVGCVTTAISAGAATIFAEVGNSDASTVVRVVAPSLPLSVAVDDSVLQYISDLDALQETRVRVLATFEDGQGLAWTLDVTDQADFIAGGAVLVAGAGNVNPLGDGPGTITALGAFGDILGVASVNVNGTDSVSIDHLHVMIPAHMDLSVAGVISAAVATADLSLQVTDLFTADGQQAPVLVHAVFTDDVETAGGSRVDVTDFAGLDLASTDPGVGSVVDGLVTASGSGTALVEATLETEAGGTVTGVATLRVQLPPPAGMDVTVQDPRLALGPADVAATVLGLPTKRQIQVVVHFMDGTSQDYTDDPSTVYEVTDSIIEVFNPGECGDCPPGQVFASGLGAGTATVEVSFNDPHLSSLSGAVELQVVTHDALDVSAWEPYTPPGEKKTPEGTLSFVEGTASRQKARLAAVEHFTDGSNLDVSTWPLLTWQVYAPGTTSPLQGVVSVEDGIARGVGVGAVELVALLGGHPSDPLPLVVDMAAEDLLALVLEYPGGATLEGIKDQGTGQLQVMGLFLDGTRDLFTGDDLVPGLLAFSTDEAHASVDAAGQATVHGNGPVVFSVAVQPAVDAGADFDVPGLRLLPVNLLPDTGDVDLGAAAGLAHPDRAADAVFTMPVRVNTGGADLGGVDLELTYDPLVLEVLDVAVGGGISGAVFSANASTPGIIYLNASPPAGAVGVGLEVAVLTFKALKGGPEVTEIGGTVVALIDEDGGPIGPATPRPIVAGAGDLDPPPGGVFGDANDDGVFSVGDVLFVRKLKAGSVIPDETQNAQSDIFPDGEVKVSDAYYASQALARLTHFVEVTATEMPGGQVFQASLVDRDQVPVDGGVAVRFEVSLSANLATVDFTLPHEITASGAVTPGSDAGGGTWVTIMTGIDTPEQVGVVVIVDVLDPEGDIVWSTPFLSTPLLDPNAPFTPLLVVGECVPACAGAACGDPDGCGGGCDGTCPVPGEVCEGGACVPQGCEPLLCEELGVDCGVTLDGCDGLLDCGGCAAGETCMGGACIPAGCDADCGGTLCGEDDGCGGICFGPCPFTAQACVDGACACMGATCDGAACGDPDGCGEVCDGPCPGPNDECADGVCVCGGTICGDDCCGQDELCQGGVCVPSCTPKECGDPGAECGEAPNGCGGTLDCGDSCGLNQWCTPEFACDCLVVECGGVCCDPLEQCIEGLCDICVPDCDGKTCGDDDGCGDICLACPGENDVCANGTCVCIADCTDKLCGESDGCGGTCDETPCAVDWEACVDGECVCLYGECGGVCCDKGAICYGGGCCSPDCVGAACGDLDGCGGTCDGTCADPFAVCQDGACGCKYLECAGVCCALGETCQGGVCT
ncbi:MAG: cohesin domain-containing protein [Pseudomonadota bacterium]